MNIHYWFLELNKSAVKRIIRKHAKDAHITVHTVSATKSALQTLENERRRGFLTIGYEVIRKRNGPAGPILNISDVRNEKQEVIIMDMYNHVLKLRRRIVDGVIDRYGDTTFFQGRNPKSMLIATLGMRIAEEITPAVFMADYICWKDYFRPDEEKLNIKNILVIPRSEWSRELAEDFRSIGLDVEISEPSAKRYRLLASVGKNLLTALIKRGFSRIQSKCYADLFANGKVMVMYAMGLKKEQRNDISFYFASGMSPSRLLVFFKSHPSWFSHEEKTWLKENGVPHFAAFGPHNSNNGVPTWNGGAFYREMVKRFCRTYLSTAAQCIGKNWLKSFGMLRWIWKTGMEIAWWKDFFLSNHVAVIVHSVPSEDNFIPNVAMAEIGGLSISIERSILFDYCTYIHNAPNHLHFITGSYSLKQIPEPTFSLYTIFSGGINVNGDGLSASGVQLLRKTAQYIVAVFDEMPNDVFFGTSVREMYMVLVELALSDSRFSLLVKSKKPQVLEKMPEIEAQLNKLVQMGRCYMADWQVTAADAASRADFVVGVPSTAVFESVLTGTRTLVYNPMRSGSSIFYSNNGLNRRIFQTPEEMKDALIRLADGLDDSVGDCADIEREIDPFNDNSGAQRLGDYINRCLDGFDKKASWQEVLSTVNKEYAARWGENTIFTTNSFEWRDNRAASSYK